MTCDRCRRRDATIHFTEVQEGQLIERHRCDFCGQPPGVEPPLPDREVDITVYSPAKPGEKKPGEKITVRATHRPTGITVQVEGVGSEETLVRLACNALRDRLNERAR